MTDKVTAFGRHLREDFLLDPAYVPVNHGSLGVYPRSIHKILREYQDEEELNPDKWLRFTTVPLLRKNRERIADFIHADTADVAFVQNASAGVTTILRSFPFDKGDKVICFESTYVNCGATLQYLEDIGLIKLIKIQLNYPLSDDQVLDIIRDTIEKNNKEGKIRLALLDALVANPGVLFPYQAASRLVQEYGILSLIDAAHAAGQIPIDVSAFDPDFLVTNLHKWLYTPRGCCIIYVPKRNQNYVHPLTINHNYKFKDGFEQEFADLGVIDKAPFLCIGAALDYRKSLGGEEAIYNYCHNLAVEGGALVAKLLGTQVLENQEKTLTAMMVNVELPLEPKTLTDAQVTSQFVEKMLYEQNSMAVGFKHNGKWWVRLSAQIYNNMDDFEFAAKAIQKVCKELSV
ncbi:pyridoxal phosphate-dependent transferase [Fennellomyces sp. T-0311]|nr:pyridoxal phosphate-dependent transferase [Fennellomyces sp. T-0311]